MKKDSVSILLYHAIEVYNSIVDVQINMISLLFLFNASSFDFSSRFPHSKVVLTKIARDGLSREIAQIEQ